MPNKDYPHEKDLESMMKQCETFKEFTEDCFSEANELFPYFFGDLPADKQDVINMMREMWDETFPN